MSDLPEINVVAVVYFPPDERGMLRESGFQCSLQSWEKNLTYESDLRLIVVNDGEPLPEPALQWKGLKLSVGHERSGYGGSLNIGFQMALERSPLALNIDDDWLLTQQFDLTPWAKLLLENDTVGSIKLMAPYPDISGRITPLQHGWVAILERHNLVAGLRAALYHKRFFDAYGWFDERISAWETERLFNERFCQMQGPDVVMALPLPWEEGPGAVVELGQEAPAIGR